MAIERAIKRGNVQQFDESYDRGFKNIWASEVDEDFNILFDAWNFGVINIADGSVTSDKLADNSVTQAKLADNAVGEMELEDGAVTHHKIADEAVTSDKIAFGSIENGHMKANSVDGLNIIDGTIMEVDLNQTVIDRLFVEAPQDGKTYGRKDLGWVEVIAGDSLWTDNPVDFTLAPTADRGIALPVSRGVSFGGPPDGSVSRIWDDGGILNLDCLYRVVLRDANGAKVTFKQNALVCDGSVVLGLSTMGAPLGGEIQYTGTRFQGYNGIDWVNLDEAGGGGGAPSGPAGGDLAGTYPNPTIGPLKVTTAALANSAVTNGKLAPTCVMASNINPQPLGADVGKMLMVGAGPALLWTNGLTYSATTGLYVSISDSIKWGGGTAFGHLIQGNASKRAEFTFNINDANVQDDVSLPSWRIRLGGATDDIQFNRHPAGGAVATLASMTGTGAWSMKDTLTDVIPASGTPPILSLGTGSSPIRFRIGSITGGNFQFYANSTMNNLKDDAAQPSLAWVYDAIAREFGFYGAPAGASVTWSQMFALDVNGAWIPNGGLRIGPAGVLKTRVVGHPSPGQGGGIFSNRDWVNSNTMDDATKPSWGLQLNTLLDQALIQRQAAGNITVASLFVFDSGGNFTILGPVGTKSTGTTWANPSDRRIKDEIANYEIGLTEILQLQPRTFVYNGKGNSTSGLRGWGFIADEVQTVIPEMVSTMSAKLEADDEEPTDIQTVDQSNLILALVNGMKELAGRVAALEAA